MGDVLPHFVNYENYHKFYKFLFYSICYSIIFTVGLANSF